MASHLGGAARELAVEILRCPIVSDCLDPDGYRLGCHDVVVAQGRQRSPRWVPEPWVGHLAAAPLLFVSSNPGGAGAAPKDDRSYTSTWSDEDLLPCVDAAFDEGQRPGIANGTRLVDRDGMKGSPVRYWIWALARASELLEHPPVPGHDYALTEVVHCGSPAENVGAWEAMRTCATLYLKRVLEASPASVMIVVGALAREAFRQHLGLGPGGTFVGPVDLAGRSRLLVFAPHPRRPGGNAPLSALLSEGDLAQLKAALAG